MADGCKHTPPTNLAGYEVESFASGPRSTSSLCKITSACDSSHVFIIRNFHLYDVVVTADAESLTGYIEVCGNTEDVVKQTQWRMTGKVPAAPYRQARGALPNGERRLSTDVRASTQRAGGQDVIGIDYSVDSPVNGIVSGARFNVPVELS
jgi:hypothetical protein